MCVHMSVTLQMLLNLSLFKDIKCVIHFSLTIKPGVVGLSRVCLLRSPSCVCFNLSLTYDCPARCNRISPNSHCLSVENNIELAGKNKQTKEQTGEFTYDFLKILLL